MMKFVPTNKDFVDIMSYLNDNGIWTEDLWLTKYDVGVVLHIGISWGDWKHDHLRLDYLIEQKYPDAIKFGTEVTEEDGSDCYSGEHRYFFPII